MAGDVDEQSAANEGASEKDHGSAGERRYRILSGNTGLSVTERSYYEDKDSSIHKERFF